MNIAQIANEIAAARRVGQFVEPPSAIYPAFTLADGYSVGVELDQILREAGWRMVGRKIGMTDESAWPSLNINRVMWAPMYDRTVVWSSEGHVQNVGHLIQPRVETEIVLALNRTIDPTSSAADLARSIEWCAAGLELIDCNFKEWEFSAEDAPADYMFHSALIVGRPLRPESHLLPAWLSSASATINLLRSGQAQTEVAQPAQVTGGPFGSLAALARLVAEQGLEPLEAGEIITTGTLTKPLPVMPGDRLSASVSVPGLPTLDVILA